jgi:hypothetical protein
MAERQIERSFSEPNLRLTCDCGWGGHDDDIESWEVESERDRVVRVCPACSEPVPEWGALGPIEGAARTARGSLRAALTDSGHLPR